MMNKPLLIRLLLRHNISSEQTTATLSTFSHRETDKELRINTSINTTHRRWLTVLHRQQEAMGVRRNMSVGQRRQGKVELTS